MTISVDELRDELRIHLGVDINDLPDADADLLTNRAYWEIIDKFKFREKEVTQTWQTVIGTRLYAAPSPFEALRQLSIEDLNDQSHTPLKRFTTYEYERDYVNRSDAQDKPIGYVRESNEIRLLPTPDNVYTITMKYWTVLADLSDSNNNPPIPQVWHEVILYGAIWRAYLRLGDLSRGNQFKSQQIALINTITPTEGKEEEDSHTAGVNVIGREYERNNFPDERRIAQHSAWWWNRT